MVHWLRSTGFGRSPGWEPGSCSLDFDPSPRASKNVPSLMKASKRPISPTVGGIFLRDLVRFGGARFLCGCRATFMRFLYGWRRARWVDLVVVERNFVEFRFVAV